MTYVLFFFLFVCVVFIDYVVFILYYVYKLYSVCDRTLVNGK